jgi:uncharacterized membrane protein required for colicin V production
MEKTSSRGLPVWLLFLGSVGAIIGFCWSEQDYVAASTLAAVTLAGLWGYHLGAMRLVGYFSSLAVAYAFAGPLGHMVSPQIMKSFDTSPGATRLISVASLSIGLFLVASATVTFVSRRLLRDRPRLENANRLLGFGFGGLQGIAAMLVLLNGIGIAEPFASERMNSTTKGNREAVSKVVSQRILDIANSTRQSAIGPLVSTYNPFEKLPQLKTLERTASVISNPEKLQKMMHSSAVDRLKNNPEVRDALESLAKDPQLRKLAESGQPLDQKTAFALLNHPGVARLLEQPNLMKHFADAIREIDSPELSNVRDTTR